MNLDAEVLDLFKLSPEPIAVVASADVGDLRDNVEPVAPSVYTPDFVLVPEVHCGAQASAASPDSVHPTIFEQTGFKRPRPGVMLPYDFYDQVIVFKFDLYDPDFRCYLKSRVGVNVTIPESEKYIKFVQHYSDEDYLNDPETAESEKGYKYDYKERMGNLRCIKRTRAMLTDLWELYQLEKGQRPEVLIP